MPSAASLFRWLLAVSIISTTAFSSSAFAQENTDEAAPAADEAPAVDGWDRLIYVPFKELQKVFDNQDASAVIPYAEYLELLKTYMNRDVAAANSPEAAALFNQGKAYHDILRSQTRCCHV